MYKKIRDEILKHKILFSIVHFFFTPIRFTREYFARRKMANELIEKYSTITRDDPIIFYFGIPEHNNLGDMAQTYCTRKWIKESYPDYKVIEIRTRTTFDKKFLVFLKNKLTDQDIFLFQSGYCSRHNNPDHLMHLNIMSRFPNQKAVILPQTVNINSKKDIENTKSIFSCCEKLLFIARDKISYDKAKDFVSEKSLGLYPDIVTSLIGRMGNVVHKSGVLLCVRNDAEKFYSDDEINTLMDHLRTRSDRVDITDTNSDMDVWSTYDNLENVIINKIKNFGTYEVIITDRYHGTIFSLIANTPVIVVKTNDHKVTSGVDWFDGIYDKSSVQLALSLEEAERLALDLIEVGKKIDNTDYFYKTYYKSSLYERIKHI